MNNAKILVVDDDERLRKLVKDYLGANGCIVIEAADGEEALRKFSADKDIRLVILDVMMPKLDGFETLRAIRQFSDVPCVMLTARSEERDQLKGYELGVDEYITKPFSPKVLTARVEAILRREFGEEAAVVMAGPIVVDKTAHTVKVNGEPVELSYKEFELLVYFMENTGVALTREQILSSVWNYDYFGDARTVDTHVKKLRSKLGASGDLIHTIWGVGYKFEL